MDGNPVALDTNIVVAHLRSAGRFDAHLAARDLFLPVTVVAELYAGAAKSARPEKNRTAVEAFLTICSVIPSDKSTADLYGTLWASLAHSGSMIPTNDIWIAATAIQHGLPLVSEDEHYSRIPELTLESW